MIGDINNLKNKESGGGDLLLYHYNWTQFNEYIMNSQQARFGAAGEELVMGREIDWISIKPLATDFNLKASIRSDGFEIEISEIDKNIEVEKNTSSINNNINNNNALSDLIEYEETFQNASSLLTDNSQNANFLNARSRNRTDDESRTNTRINEATRLPKNLVSAVVDTESMAVLRKQLQLSLNKLQLDYAGNLAGLQAYISEMNSWKSEFRTFLDNRKKLWVFLMTRLSQNIKYELYNQQAKYSQILQTTNTYKLYELLKQITGVYREQNVARIKEEWLALRQLKPDGKLMILPEFIYKFDNYLKELSYTKQGTPGDEERMSLFMLYGIDQVKYATTINKFTQLPVYSAEEFVNLKTELLRIDKKVNNEAYGPLAGDNKINKKNSNPQVVEKFQGNLATNFGEKNLKPKSDLSQACETTSDGGIKNAQSNNNNKAVVQKSSSINSGDNYKISKPPQGNVNTNNNPDYVDRKRNRVEQEVIPEVSEVNNNKKLKKRMFQCFKCGREHPPGCKRPVVPCEKCKAVTHCTSMCLRYQEYDKQKKLNIEKNNKKLTTKGQEGNTAHVISYPKTMADRKEFRLQNNSDEDYMIASDDEEVAYHVELTHEKLVDTTTSSTERIKFDELRKSDDYKKNQYYKVKDKLKNSRDNLKNQKNFTDLSNNNRALILNVQALPFIPTSLQKHSNDPDVVIASREEGEEVEPSCSDDDENQHTDETFHALVVKRSDIEDNTTLSENFIIDSGASINVFNSLKSIEGMVILTIEEVSPTDESSQLTGISGKSLKTSHKGHIQGLGRFLVVPNAVHNLISIPQLIALGIYEIQFGDTGCVIKYKSNKEHIMRLNTNRANMYVATKTEVLMMSNVESYSQEAFTTTQGDKLSNNITGEEEVDNKKKQMIVYTKEQIARAQEVIKLHLSLDHPSNYNLINALNNGTILGTRLTEQDVVRSEHVFGKCIHCIAGKTVKPAFKPSESEPAEKIASIIHADIHIFSDLTIGSNVGCIISVDEFSCYIYVVMLKSKSMLYLNLAFDDIISHYKLYGHSVVKFQTDSESNLGACTIHLTEVGVILEQVPPYQHAQRIERYIRTINDRVRAILDTLVYELPPKLYGELLSSVVLKHNDLPTTNHLTLTPRILVQGTKLNLKETCLMPFGTLCMFHEAGDNNLKITDPRSQLGVALGPSRRSRQSIRAYILSTQTVKVRSHYEILGALPVDFEWKLKIEPNKFKLSNKVQIHKTNFQLVSKLPFVTNETDIDLSAEKEGVIKKVHTKPRKLTGHQVVYRDADLQQDEEVESDEDFILQKKENDAAAQRLLNSNIVAESLRPRLSTILAEPGRSDMLESNDNITSTLTLENEEGELLEDTKKRSLTISNDTEVKGVKSIKNAKTKHLKTSDSYIESSSNSKVPLRKSSSKEKSEHDQPQEGVSELQKSLDEVHKKKYPNRSRQAKLRNWKDMKDLMYGYSISVKQALISEYAQQTKEAVCDEIKNFLDYKVGHYVRFSDIPLNHRKSNILFSFMFIKHKMKPDGRYDKTKARLVGDGSKQGKHMYELIASTTVSLSIVFVLFNIASYFRCRLVSYDIKGAFLHASFTDEDEPTYLLIRKEVVDIWIKLDETAIPFVNTKGDLILLLDKFVYGLKQSPLKFQLHLTGVLKLLGYVRSEFDDCLYTKVIGERFSIISTHVDDILQVTNCEEMLNNLHKGLDEAYGTCQFNEKADSYLGMNITRDGNNRVIRVDHEGSISKLIDEHIPDEAKACGTPHQDTLFEVLEESGENCTLDIVANKRYLSIVMSLMYIARLTRPDILLPVTYLASRSHYATGDDWEKLMRVLLYLKGTPKLGITINCSGLQLHCHCDASFGTHGDGRSHTGFAIYLGPTLSYLHAKSNKQKVGSTSSTDAEIIALVDSMKVLIWLKRVLTELDVGETQIAVVHQDNQSCMMMVKDQSKCNRSKHMLTKINYAKDLIASLELEVRYLYTNNMSADMLTKPLGGSLFRKHRDTIMGTISDPDC